jgi:hypothetical protein
VSKINTIEALRDHALNTLEKLSNGEIDTTEAGVTGKLCESVISTIKAQLEYARMIDQEPQILFMQKSHLDGKKVIEGTLSHKQLTNQKK